MKRIWTVDNSLMYLLYISVFILYLCGVFPSLLQHINNVATLSDIKISDKNKNTTKIDI